MVQVQHPVVWTHHAGWFYQDDKKDYFYGTGVDAVYSCKIPEGFEVRDIPASYYVVFDHPKFEYLRDNGEVMKRVEALAWTFDSRMLGYTWNEDKCQDYQRHMPDHRGYQVLRPVIKL